MNTLHRLFRVGLRGRLLLLGILPALATGVLALLAGHWSLSRLQDARLAAELQAADARLDQAIAEAARRMHAHVAGVVPRPNIIQALGTRDQDRTQRLLVDTFAALRIADPTLAVLEATDAAGRVLDRAQAPGQRGDDRSQAADVRRALDGQVASGPMLPAGTTELTIGATLPVRDSGRIVGTVRAAMRLDAAAAAMLGTAAGGDVLLFTGGELTATTFAGLGQDQLPPALRDAVRDTMRDGSARPLATTLSGAPYTVVTKPLRRATGEAIGAIAVALPMAGWQAAMQEGVLLSLGAALLALLGALPAAVLAARRLGAALDGLATAMAGIADGRLDLPVPGRGRADEVGRMGNALDVLRQGLLEKRRLERDAAEERALRERRTVALEGHAAGFGHSVASVLAALDAAAGQMRDAAIAMADGARGTEAEAEATAAAAGSSANNLAAVAAAAEELASSVAEIARQVTLAAEVARAGVTAAESSEARMATLAASAASVTEVTRLIGDIAAQTNLLALNATIEAARAGEAGKGFAVVASEVKTLAGQTARATEDVARQIGDMRDATEDAAQAMKTAFEAIARMDEVAAAIAAAVEQQGTATREINARVQEVSGTVGNVAQAMHGLAGTAQATGQLGGRMLASADRVASETGVIRAEVETFLARLAAENGERRRHARLELLGTEPARLRLDGKVHLAALRDIAEGGAALRSTVALAAGTPLEVQLPGEAGWFQAQVVRSEEGVTAVAFKPAALAEAARAVARLRAAEAQLAA